MCEFERFYQSFSSTFSVFMLCFVLFQGTCNHQLDSLDPSKVNPCLWIDFWQLEDLVEVSLSCSWQGIWSNFHEYMDFPCIKHTNALPCIKHTNASLFARPLSSHFIFSLTRDANFLLAPLMFCWESKSNLDNILFMI